jgi:hypothetical protein
LGPSFWAARRNVPQTPAQLARRATLRRVEPLGGRPALSGYLPAPGFRTYRFCCPRAHHKTTLHRSKEHEHASNKRTNFGIAVASLIVGLGARPHANTPNLLRGSPQSRHQSRDSSGVVPPLQLIVCFEPGDPELKPPGLSGCHYAWTLGCLITAGFVLPGQSGLPGKSQRRPYVACSRTTLSRGPTRAGWGPRPTMLIPAMLSQYISTT